MRYVQIYDLRDRPRCWRNHNVLATYYYCCCAADYKTRRLRRSLRTMAREIDLTLSAFRHALKVLQEEGLVEVESLRTETIITIPTKLIERQAIFSPEAILLDNQDKLIKVLGCSKLTLPGYIERFAQVQALAGKTWPSEREVTAHFAQWYLKVAKTPDTLHKEIASAAMAPDSQEPTQHNYKQELKALEQEWREKILDARRRAELGEEEAEEWLKQTHVAIQIKKYGL